MVERETLIVLVEDVVELLAKSLGVVQELQGREVGRCLLSFLLFLFSSGILLEGWSFELGAVSVIST